jgi:cobalt ECF transporter T component CbiQ
LAAAVMLLAVSLMHHPASLGALYAVGLLAAATSRVPMWPLLRREWIVVALFTGVVAAPAMMQRVTPGPILLALPHGFTLSETGVIAAARLVLRAVASVHVALLLTQTTPWHRLLRGLRSLGAPAVAVMVLSICHRYIYLLLRMAGEMLTGREARRVGRVNAAQARGQIAASAGALMVRSQDTATAVFQAMAARGFRGEPKELSPSRFTAADAALVVGSIAFGVAAYLIGGVLNV